MRLRLYHHSDGARVAYWELGAGQPIGLLHSGLLSHQEFAPSASQLAERFRVVLPDMPLHGDSEDRPRHPYTLDWFAEVIGGFAADVLGPRPIIGGHGAAVLILLRAIEIGALRPSKLVLMPSSMHRRPQHPRLRAAWRLCAGAGAMPGLDRLLTHAAKLLFSPERGMRLSASGERAAADLMRQAFADVPGNANLARSWSKCARRWPSGPRPDLLSLYPQLTMPVLLLWADRDRMHPLSIAEEALDLLPNGQLRILQGSGFLMAYDDPIGFAREISAFCG